MRREMTLYAREDGLMRSLRTFGANAGLIVVVFRINGAVRIFFLLSRAAHTRRFLSGGLERDFGARPARGRGLCWRRVRRW